MNKNSPYRIAVVIPTKDRADDLLGCIKSIYKQQRLPDQVIVVDQSSTTIPKDKVDNFILVNPCELELIYVHDPAINGLVAAKEYGVQISQADIILFHEDDEVLESNYIAVLEQGFINDPDMYGSSGVVREVKGRGWAYRGLFKIFHRGMFSDPRVDIHGSASKFDGRMLPCDYLSGGLSAYRREVFERVPFDTKNDLFMLEDVDFSTRAALTFGDKRFYINTGAILEHVMSPVNRPIKFPKYQRKIREFICFYKKNHDRKGYGWTTPSLLWLLLGLLLEAGWVSLRTLSLGPVFGFFSGLLQGIRKKVIPLGSEKKVLIMCPYPFGEAPGQRFRYEQYLDVLRKSSFIIDTQSFLDADTMKIIYMKGHTIQKIAGVLSGFIRRFVLLFSVSKYDYIFLFREAAPVGPPVIESFLFMLRRKVIYDFDDAIFLPQKSDVNSLITLVKCPSKVGYITRKSHAVAVCNLYLKEWARKLNDNVILIPTTIDFSYHKRDGVKKKRNLPVIGWTGSHSTAKYLEIIRPVLKLLQVDHDFEFQVICDIDPDFNELKNYSFVKWSKEHEIEDLQKLDIGLMPVPEGSWEKGKVGFKAIQYSALEIVPVVSNIGSGHEVVINGKTGFVVENTEKRWCEALGRLLENRSGWDEMGKAAKEHVYNIYSVDANVEKYVNLFR